jgi:hypothetical protein
MPFSSSRKPGGNMQGEQSIEISATPERVYRGFVVEPDQFSR